MPNCVDLSKYDNSYYHPGKNSVVRFIWYVCNYLLLQGPVPGSGWRRGLLRIFGAKIGKSVVVKPHVKVKYPWKLIIGDYTWIGEEVWIDNLGLVKIGAHACLSQGALLLCGNHNYKKTTFDLMVGDIVLEDGVWVGAKSIVTGGSVLHTNVVVSAGSMCSGEFETNGIFAGSPAQKIKERKIEQ